MSMRAGAFLAVALLIVGARSYLQKAGHRAQAAETTATSSVGGPSVAPPINHSRNPASIAARVDQPRRPWSVDVALDFNDNESSEQMMKAMREKFPNFSSILFPLDPDAKEELGNLCWEKNILSACSIRNQDNVLLMRDLKEKIESTEPGSAEREVLLNQYQGYARSVGRTSTDLCRLGSAGECAEALKDFNSQRDEVVAGMRLYCQSGMKSYCASLGKYLVKNGIANEDSSEPTLQSKIDDARAILADGCLVDMGSCASLIWSANPSRNEKDTIAARQNLEASCQNPSSDPDQYFETMNACNYLALDKVDHDDASVLDLEDGACARGQVTTCISASVRRYEDSGDRQDIVNGAINACNSFPDIPGFEPFDRDLVCGQLIPNLDPNMPIGDEHWDTLTSQLTFMRAEHDEGSQGLPLRKIFHINSWLASRSPGQDVVPEPPPRPPTESSDQ